MAERPIPFNAPMVRALLSDQKTQARTAIKPQPLRAENPDNEGYSLQDFSDDAARMFDHKHVPCPYQVGDLLWVLEAWAEVPRHEPHTDEDLPWREDGRILVYAADPEWNGARQFLCADGVMRWAKPECWRPSDHMPRWASRIELEVTGVRVERLRDISEADILAEGITVDRVAEWCNTPWSMMPTLHHAWRVLWESINGAGNWDANPWVWVVEFKRHG